MTRVAGCIALLFLALGRPASAVEFRVRSGAGERVFVSEPTEWFVREAGGLRLVRVPSRNALPTAVAPGVPVRAVLYPAGAPKTPRHRHLLTPGVAARLPGTLRPEALAQRVGAAGWRTLQGVPGVHVFESGDPSPEGVASLADALGRVAGVEGVSPVLARPRVLRALPSDPFFPRQWHLQNNGQSGGTKGADLRVVGPWAAGLTGRGIRIGFVDDGVESVHPDLVANARPDLGHDYRDGDDDPSPDGVAGIDNHGQPRADSHGTAVAGIASAAGDNRLGVTGVAYRSTLIPIRLVGPDMESDEQEAGALAHGLGVVDISNNPWGPADDGQTLEMPGPLAEAALEAGVREGRGGRGVVYVWSAGNGGEEDDNANGDGYANAVQVIAVGALTDDGQRAPYSEPGACVMVTAPGGGNFGHFDGIVTTDLKGARGYNDLGDPIDLMDADYTQVVEGTSASAPMVSGVVALMLEANPLLGWRDVQEVLMRSARFVVPQDPGWGTNRAGFRFNPGYGAGMVDAAAAVQLARTWTNLPRCSIAVAAWTPDKPAAIPDGNGAALVHPLDIGSDLRVEHVRLSVDVVHPNRGELLVELVSPSGTTNRLFLPHVDPNPDVLHRFTSVQCWGERSAGTWRMRVVDGERENAGEVRSATLEVLGTPPQPLPPASLSVAHIGADGTVLSVGGVPGERWRVDAGEDLGGWSRVGEVVLADGIGRVTDAARGTERRFYRAVRMFP